MDYTSFAPGTSANPSIPPKLQLPPPQRHFFNKKFATTFFACLALGGIAVGGFWWWQQMRIALDDESLLDVPLTADQQAGWKTYTNTQYGFQFDYPSLTANDIVVDPDPSHVYFDGHATIDGPSVFVGPYWIIPTKDKNQEQVMADVINRTLEKADAKAVSDDGSLCQRISVSDTHVLAVNCSGVNSYLTYGLIKNNDVWIFFMQSIDGKSVKDPNALRQQELRTLSSFKFTGAAGQFCGGIGAIKCPSGYQCSITERYPDAGGTCVKQ